MHLQVVRWNRLRRAIPQASLTLAKSARASQRSSDVTSFSSSSTSSSSLDSARLPAPEQNGGGEEQDSAAPLSNQIRNIRVGTVWHHMQCCNDTFFNFIIVAYTATKKEMLRKFYGMPNEEYHIQQQSSFNPSSTTIKVHSVNDEV
jgi:hypothetical protein